MKALINNEMNYIAPAVDVFQITLQGVLNSSNTETPTGGDNPDNPWPTNP